MNSRPRAVHCCSTPMWTPPPVMHSMVHVQKHQRHQRPLWSMLQAPPLTLGTITYGDFLKEVEDGRVSQVQLTGDKHKVSFTDKAGYEDEVQVPNVDAPAFMDKLIAKQVDIVYDQSDKERNIIMFYLGIVMQYLGIFLLGYLFLQLMVSQTQKSGTGFTFGKSSAKLLQSDSVSIRFTDVAGLDQAKLELQEVIDFLKQPERYTAVGGKIPKGCLLVGPPGTGKTLLAKAVAGEAGVPFYSCSASEFVELFVGVGASRVRDLFQKASKTAPCIIFIDEIDAIGKARGSPGPSMGGGNDEREQTINQLLTEMDGFQDNNGVIVIAATNRAEILDQALLRPGRFDRQITVDLPDLHGRTAILEVHTKNKPLDSSVTIEDIAKVTTGFSGADLANLANEAAILAARNKRSQINRTDFDKALERVMLGFEKKPIASEAKRLLVAYHEAGHTLAALKVCPNGSYDIVRKVTILPRGKTGGVTLFEPDADRLESGLYTKEYLENQIVVALGGRVAEEIVYGKDHVTTGASSDLEKVQQVARMMVAMYGFTGTVGPIAWKPSSKIETPFSEHMLAEIDQDVKLLAERCYRRAKDILAANRDLLDKIAFKLVECETLTYEDLKELMES